MSAKSILDIIRERQGMTPEQIKEAEKAKEFRRTPLSADDWQEFKRLFVEEYGGEKIQADGMTHSEFLQYLKDGTREGVEAYSDSKKLRDFLNSL